MRPLIWLSPVVTLACAIAVYRDAYASEDGRYAGAEPALTGLWVAGPLILLFLAQVVCALGFHTAMTPRGRTACIAGVMTAGVASVAVTIAFLAG